MTDQGSPLGNRKMILVVDDQPEILRTISRILRDYELVLANDGEIGWDMYETHKPDLTLTDYRMPNMNGIELCEKIRRSNFGAKIILMSGDSYDVLKDDLDKIGVEFLDKPFTRGDLIERVDFYLRDKE